ncbi:hypothetical protein KKA14_02485, partial [bacterium]|nr:hypothetical protein [bacterium]
MKPIINMKLVVALSLIMAIVLSLPEKVYPDSEDKAKKHHILSIQLADQKNIVRAIEEAKQAEFHAPENGFYAYYLGIIYQNHAHRYKNAIEAFDRAIKKGHQTESVYYNKVHSYCNLKDYSNAIKAFQKTIELGLKDLDKALELKKADEVKKKKAQITNYYGWLGSIYYQQDEFIKGFKAAEEGYRFIPDSFDKRLAETYVKAATFLGFIALGDEEYDEAIRYFKAARNNQKDNPDLSKMFVLKDVTRFTFDELIQIVENRKKLGEISPQYIHRILVLNIEEVDVDFEGSNKQRIRAHNYLSESQKKRHLIFQAVLKKIVESFSDGNFSLVFEQSSVSGSIKDIEVATQKAGNEYRAPILETITSDPGKIFFENRNKYDTFVICWNGENNVATNHTGGQTELPYLAYRFYSPKRGYMSMPVNWSEPLWLFAWIHEYFHVIESLTGIKPAHGFYQSNRSHFPQWKGNTEFDYYRWHFKKTLNKIGWVRLNFRMRYPDNTSFETIEKIRLATKHVPLKDLEKAHSQINTARQYDFTSAKAVNLYEKAYAINPFNPHGLNCLSNYYNHVQINKKKAVKYYKELSAVAPDYNPFINLALLYHYDFGQFDEAIQSYISALKYLNNGQNDRKLMIYANLGQAQLKADDFRGAIKSFEAGLDQKVNLSDKK